MSDPSRAIRQVLSGKSYFEVFGLPRCKAQPNDIRSAYKKLALLIHPDKNPDPNAATAFKRLNAAHQCLSDDKRQSAYLLKHPKRKRKRKDNTRGTTASTSSENFYGFREASESSDRKEGKWWEKKDWIDHIERETELFKRQYKATNDEIKQNKRSRKRRKAWENRERMKRDLRHIREKYGLDEHTGSEVKGEERKRDNNTESTSNPNPNPPAVPNLSEPANDNREQLRQLWALQQCHREWKRELEKKRDSLRLVKEEFYAQRDMLRKHLTDSTANIKAQQTHLSQQSKDALATAEDIIQRSIKDMQAHFQRLKAEFDLECLRHRSVREMEQRITCDLDVNSAFLAPPQRDRQICWVCRRRFDSVMKRKMHTRESELHKQTSRALRQWVQVQLEEHATQQKEDIATTAGAQNLTNYSNTNG